MDEDLTLRFSLRLPKELHDRLTASANEKNASLNGEIIRLLERGLEKETERAPDKSLLEQILSPAMIWRINRFRDGAGLVTNEEATKRLIKMALDEKETTTDILEKLYESYEKEKDLRMLARDVIAAHSAVESINYGKDYVWFNTKTHESGAIDKKGRLYFSEDGNDWDCSMEFYTPDKFREFSPPQKQSRLKKSWDSPPSDDLDDTIPF